jgi:predicted acylesterase/phospholipase RssA
MPQTIPLHFVFQGGGAKLGCLLAAADAIFENSARLGYTIKSVSGTSAGAIVGCMLATGEDPKVFKSIIQEHGPGYVDLIAKPLSFRSMVWRAWWGSPFYDADQYTKFLDDIFSSKLLSKQYTYAKDLAPNIDFYMHAVDIRDRKPVVYEAKDGRKIVDILLDSSGIPFVFKTFSSSSVVDGGLVDNFPVNSIWEKIDQQKMPGSIVGISFEPDKIEWSFKNPVEYARALLSTVIDNPVNTAIRKVDKHDVHLIKTNTSTFDFKTALQVDLADKQYGEYKKQAIEFLEKLMERKWLRAATLPADTFIKRILDLHDTLMSAQKVRVKQVTLKTTSNCLKSRARPNIETPDEIETTVEIEVAEGPVFTYGMGFRSDQRFVNIGDVKVSVFDKDDDLVGATVLPFTPQLLDRDRLLGARGNADEVEPAVRNNLVIFFQKPLEAGQRYRITHKTRAEEVLSDLDTDARRDVITYYNLNFELVEKLRIIAYIPDRIRVQKAEDGTYVAPKDAKWVSGRPLTAAELKKVDTEEGFAPVGWEVLNVGKKMAGGFTVYAE